MAKRSRSSAAIEADLRQTIRAAEGGDHESALLLIKMFVDAIADSRRQRIFDTLPHMRERLLGYFARCFDAMLHVDEKGSRISADRALHLSVPGKRGRKRKRTTDKNHRMMGFEVYRAVQHGAPRKAAIIETAARYRKGTEVVRAGYDQVRALFGGIPKRRIRKSTAE
jgi:hypothetical protein